MEGRGRGREDRGGERIERERGSRGGERRRGGGREGCNYNIYSTVQAKKLLIWKYFHIFTQKCTVQKYNYSILIISQASIPALCP